MCVLVERRWHVRRHNTRLVTNLKTTVESVQQPGSEAVAVPAHIGLQPRVGGMYTRSPLNLSGLLLTVQRFSASSSFSSCISFW